jgi:hypothetical protein
MKRHLKINNDFSYRSVIWKVKDFIYGSKSPNSKLYKALFYIATFVSICLLFWDLIGILLCCFTQKKVHIPK